MLWVATGGGTAQHLGHVAALVLTSLPHSLHFLSAIVFSFRWRTFNIHTTASSSSFFTLISSFIQNINSHKLRYININVKRIAWPILGNEKEILKEASSQNS